MKYLKELFWITLIGQAVVWSIVYLSSLLPSFAVGALIGVIGAGVGQVFYYFFVLIKERI